MAKKNQLIIFDMDGTLIDSGDVITNTINYVRKNLGLTQLDKKTMLTQLNNPHINSADFFYGTSKFTDKQTKLFEDYYEQNCTKDIKIYDGIKQLLEELNTKYILSVATNAATIYAKQMLQAVGIDKYFDYIIGFDKVTNPKPSQEMIVKTLEYFDIIPNNALVVGDSHKDSISAKKANVKPILVNWGFTDHSDNVISNTIDLKKEIDDYFNTNR